MKFRTLIAAVLALAVAIGGGRLRRRSTTRRAAARRRRRLGRRRLDEALARRLLDAAGGLRRGHPRLPARPPAGKGVAFSESYGASGDQSRAVEAGLPADVVAFSLAPDMTRLVKAGLVARRLGRRRRTRASCRRRSSRSSCARATRRTSTTWDDLLKPGVKVADAEPVHLGRARSGTCMAAYGAKSDGGKDPQAGLAYLRELITKHVKVQDKSGREALQDFTSGNGDVLLSYENEAITAQKKGQDGRLRHPGRDDPDREPDRGRLEGQAPRRRPRRSSTTCCRRPAQEMFADWGYRPVDAGGAGQERRQVPDARRACSRSTTSAAGAKVNDEFFDPDKGVGRQDRGGRGGLHCQVRRSPRASPAAAPRARRRAAAGALGARDRDAVAERHRPAAAGRASSPRSIDGGLGAFWDAVTSRQAVAALTLHAARRRWSSRRSTR